MKSLSCSLLSLHRLPLFTLAAAALVVAGCSTCPPPPAETVAAPPAETVEQAWADLPPKAEWKASASGVQEDTYPAAFACDGKTDTRWSSPAADVHWLQIDLGRTALVAGITILWEDAFSSEYAILASTDGSDWTEVYAAKNADGKTDDIYFRAVPARFVKVLGTKRATGWGHSIWEIDLKGTADVVRVEAPTRDGSDVASLFDGRLESRWISATPAPVTLTVDLQREKSIGGVRIDWGDHYATELDLYVSRDGSAWSKLSEMKEGIGLFDILLHPKVSTRYLRLEAKAGDADAPLEIREISLRGPDETLTPLAVYQIAAQKAPEGYYPLQLLKQQVYWTLVGLPGDRRESLLDEYGNLEAVQGSSSLTPYLFTGGKLHSALDAEVSQALEAGYLPLPSVTWALDGLDLRIEAFAWGATDKSVTYARYLLSNAADRAQSGRLFLAVRPVQVNPTWQYGGLAPIRSMGRGAFPDGFAVNVNGTEQYIALVPPDGFGCRPFDRGDVVRDLAAGELPADAELDDAGEFVSGALAYDFDLPPGGTRSVVVAAPLHGTADGVYAFLRHGPSELYTPDEAFSARRQGMRLWWAEQLDRVTVDVPDRAVADTLKSQIAYILINRDGVAIQPGSRNYKRSWIRDGCMTSAAMLRMGLVEPVREYLDWYAERVYPNGMVPPILNNDGTVNEGFGSDLEYDSQGEFIYALMEFYRFTKDRAFLERHFDKIHRAMEFMAHLREQTLAPDYMKDTPGRERFVGILPPSYSHEGYSPPVHSYWDDFFALKGWRDGRGAAEVLGLTEVAAWADEQYRQMSDSVLASIRATMAFKDIDFIPGCAEKGDADATSTTIAFFPCEEGDLLPGDGVRALYDRYYADIRRRVEPGWSGGFTPYEVRNIAAFARLGQKDRAEFLLDFLMDCRRPPAWNHLAEVVLSDPRMGSYIGDMPHTWVGSGYVNSIRGMLVREDEGRLVLLAGAPESWVREGRGVRLSVPTHFGDLALRARAVDRELRVELGGSAEPPDGYALTWPLPGVPSGVTVDGAPWTDFDETSCRLPAGTTEVVAQW